MPTCENNGVSFPEFLREEPQREVHALLVQSWYAKKGGKIVVVTGNAVYNYTGKVLSLPLLPWETSLLTEGLGDKFNL